MRQAWLYFCYRFDAAAVNSLTLSVPYVNCLSVFIDDFKVYQWLCFRRWFVDEPWLSVFDNSLRQPCLYFCYRYNTSIVNSLTLFVPYISCHSVFIDDFKFSRDSVFANDSWISSAIAFLRIPYVRLDSIFAIDLMWRSWIYWHCRFHTSTVSQYSLTISSSTGTLFSLTIYGLAMTYHFWQFHASTMTLFLLSIWCVDCEFINAIDYIHLLSLNFHWWFQVRSGLYFRWRFIDQHWHSVSDNSMCQSWLYFCYRFDASVVNSLTLSITYVCCHWVFTHNFKVYIDSVFADDLWISSDIVFFTISCVSHDSIFAIDLMRRSWIHWHCRLHTSVVTEYSFTISRSTLTLFVPLICGWIVT